MTGRPLGEHALNILHYLRYHKGSTVAEIARAMRKPYRETSLRIRPLLVSGRLTAMYVPSKKGQALGYVVNKKWKES